VAAAFPQGLFDPTGYAAASVVIWAAVIAGLASRVLPSSPVGSTAAVAGLCLAGTAVLATASVAWASDQGRAFEEAVRVSFYLGLFVLAACTASRGGRSAWLGGLTAGLAIVSVIALLAYLQPRLLTDPGNEVANAAGRLSYPLGYWNGMAALFAVAAILLARAGAEAPTHALRTAGTALLPLALLGIWLADSRGGVAAAVLGLGILLASSPDRPRQTVSLAIGIAAGAVLIAAGDAMDTLRNGLGDSAMRADGDRMSALVVGIVALAGGIAWRLDGHRVRLDVPRAVRLGAIGLAGIALVGGAIAADPVERFREFKQPPDAATGTAAVPADVSSNGRWQFWSAAVDAFESKPIEGVGAGGYEDWWAQHTSVPLFVRNPHSLPLQQGAELGIPGLALFLGFLIVVGLAARGRLSAGRGGDGGVLVAVVTAGAVGAAVDWTWEIPAAFGPAVVCAALLCASAPSGQPARDGYWLGLGTVAAAWLAMIAGGLVVLSEIDLRQSRNAAAESRFADAIDSAERARTVLPWSAEPYTQLALLEEERGDITGALTYLRRAEERDSQDWRLALIEARLQATRGNMAEARMALERARSLSPRLPISGAGGSNQG
jgi:O-Antigen ligase